jgi:hypothetical protein
VNPAAFAHLTVFLPCILSVRCWEFMWQIICDCCALYVR